MSNHHHQLFTKPTVYTCNTSTRNNANWDPHIPWKFVKCMRYADKDFFSLVSYLSWFTTRPIFWVNIYKFRPSRILYQTFKRNNSFYHLLYNGTNYYACLSLMGHKECNEFEMARNIDSWIPLILISPVKIELNKQIQFSLKEIAFHQIEFTTQNLHKIPRISCF